RRTAHVVLTNPDMLHVGILPQHENWGRFLRSLRFVVLDEMHSYRGVFGSHVGGVLRRLLRLCEWYRSKPTVISCSATVANPEELFSRLTGRTAVLVDTDGAPRSERVVALVEPPEGQDNYSPNRETASLLAELCRADVRTLAFCRARISTELVVRYAREALGSGGSDQVESYRGGYTPEERRDIEQRLFGGGLTALATTNAMELGVDVGGLDAIVLNGYPGSISSFWQQVGRAGRADRPGFAAMLAHEDPLEQFIVRNPAVLQRGRMESVTVNPENPHVLAAQLRCAAYERALAPEDLERFGPAALDVAETLTQAGDLEFSAGRYFYPSHDAPAPKVNIRGVSGESVALLAADEQVGEMERWRAMQYAHEGAVYMHRSRTFVVDRLDLGSNQAVMSEAEPGYYTQPIVQSLVVPTVTVSEKPVGGAQAVFGGVSVTTTVSGFRKMAQDGRQTLGEERLDLPPLSYDTVGVRFALGEEWSPTETEDGVGAVHGLEHALTAVAPILASCDRRDLGSAWFTVDPGSLAPAVYVFDAAPGGVGLSEKLYERAGDWALMAVQLLEGCKCEEGCPACLLSPQCECMNEHLSKSGALRLAKSLCP
ncbi:MAG: DUF1998 domain-containing protein, partial [Armatimonadetes bacterium]|nr:DUF1998 domain-containing protein [Armatimonadota bacterium]